MEDNEIVLEKFFYKGTQYYKDKFGIVWDQNAIIIGSTKGFDVNGDPICYFFDTKYDCGTDIKSILSGK
jgi:hypothetical protein